ncbi:hypothetical protein NPIL_81601, partial [Nephila pilipes]
MHRDKEKNASTPSTNKQAVPVLELENNEPFNYKVTSTSNGPIHKSKGTQNSRASLPSK